MYRPDFLILIIYALSIRQFIGEYIGLKKNLIIYSLSIGQFIGEYIGLRKKILFFLIIYLLSIGQFIGEYIGLRKKNKRVFFPDYIFAFN